jgi:hypothetical protein
VNSKHTFPVFAMFVLSAILSAGTPALAGTTGMLSGTVVDENGHPVPNASVIATSPVGLAKTTTASDGRFVYLSLIPGIYVVTVEKRGYQPVAIPDITIAADQSPTLNLVARRALISIHGDISRLPCALVQPNVVPDLYRVTPTQQQKLTVAGGGNGFNNALSALSTVPGVYVAPGVQWSSYRQ